MLRDFVSETGISAKTFPASQDSSSPNTFSSLSTFIIHIQYHFRVYKMSNLLGDDSAVELPSPPFITVTGIPNFRDLGGYPVAGSKKHSFRRGIVYRCGEPTSVKEDGISTMSELGITHIYDLRSNIEIERNVEAGRGGVKEWEGCERVFVPIFPDEDYSPEKLAVRFNDYVGGTEVSEHEDT
jgi:hypothetical protein